MTRYQFSTRFRTTKTTNADARSKTSLYRILFTPVWQPVKSLGRDTKKLVSTRELLRTYSGVRSCHKQLFSMSVNKMLQLLHLQQQVPQFDVQCEKKLLPLFRDRHVCLARGRNANSIRIHVNCFSNCCRTTLNTSKTRAERHKSVPLCFIIIQALNARGVKTRGCLLFQTNRINSTIHMISTTSCIHTYSYTL